MLERRMVAGAVAYSAVFLGDQVQVSLKDTTVPLGPVNRNTEISNFTHFRLQTDLLYQSGKVYCI